MKKLFLFSTLTFIASIFIASVSFAAVQIYPKNIGNNEQLFIISLVSGESYDAVRVGNYAIVSDKELKNYMENTVFAIGVGQGPTMLFCTNQNARLFEFNYKKYTNTAISLERTYLGLTCRNLA